jgi:hypothetical protein
VGEEGGGDGRARQDTWKCRCTNAMCDTVSNVKSTDISTRTNGKGTAGATRKACVRAHRGRIWSSSFERYSKSKSPREGLVPPLRSPCGRHARNLVPNTHSESHSRTASIYIVHTQAYTKATGTAPATRSAWQSKPDAVRATVPRPTPASPPPSCRAPQCTPPGRACTATQGSPVTHARGGGRGGGGHALGVNERAV